VRTLALLSSAKLNKSEISSEAFAADKANSLLYCTKSYQKVTKKSYQKVTK
jgi:hypothetical protein